MLSKKTLAIAKWEYLEKVKTKAFIISLILTPAIILVFSIAPTLLANKEDSSTKIIGILDLTGTYFSDIKTEIEEFKLEDGQPNYLITNLSSQIESVEEVKSSADEKVLSGRLDGYLLIGESDSVKQNIEYRSKSIGNFRDISRFTNAFNTVRINQLAIKENINTKIITYLNERLEINQIKIEEDGKEGETGFEVVFFSSFIFIMLLMMIVIYSGQMLVRSLLEEKSNRIIEILVSSCSSNELLGGKVLGLSALGLTQIIIWTLVGLSLAGGALIPPNAFDNVPLIFVYFVLGFVFFTTLFVGIGSVVSTEQEAQQITSYLSIILVIPVVIVFPAMQNPETLLIKVLSYIPFTSPSVMILRVNIAPIPLWEILVTVGILVLSTYLMIVLSAKIFRIGILSYGKMPNLRELKLWLKDN